MRKIQVLFECSVVGCDASTMHWVPVVPIDPFPGYAASPRNHPPGWSSLMSEEIRLDWWKDPERVMKEEDDLIFCEAHAWRLVKEPTRRR